MNVSQIATILSFAFQKVYLGTVCGDHTTLNICLNMSTQREHESQDRSIVKIAAHLPDLIVYGDFSPERPSVDYFDGVLMFVDISGKHKRDV